MLPGRVYSEEIADIITDGCRKVVVILSPDYIESEWCSFAVKMAVHVSPGEGGGREGENYIITLLVEVHNTRKRGRMLL